MSLRLLLLTNNQLKGKSVNSIMMVIGSLRHVLVRSFSHSLTYLQLVTKGSLQMTEYLHAETRQGHLQAT